MAVLNSPQPHERHQFYQSQSTGNVVSALQEARLAREQARSYRNFKVGAAIVGLTFLSRELSLFTGYNIKPAADSHINIHAEELALQAAHAEKIDAVSLVTIVGDTQLDQQSGREMLTLHPCGLCRNALDDDPLVLNDSTLVFSALPDFSTVEYGTVNDFTHYHHADPGESVRLRQLSLPPIDNILPTDPAYIDVLNRRFSA
ncbi:hypothetical protein B7Y94_02520 [Candidatus Saccharibacteria bacterium 32-49-12]|nr:MAG: hypothetical protein B7Y94_02520 [Candidatus Saccharibacteria bacterium 32-49-12]